MLYLLFAGVLGISINGDFEVAGQVTCASLEVQKVTSEGSIEIDSSLVAEDITTTYTTTESLTVSKITSPTGSITIQGNMNLFPASSTASSFLQRSWQINHVESFKDSISGWLNPVRKVCNEGFYLEGNCENEKISKKFHLPSHNYVRLIGILHFLDLWNGERVEIKVDGSTVWSRKAQSPKKGISVCGSEHPVAEFSTNFDIMVPHTSEEMMLSFESSLNKKNCHATFALSEVTLLTRSLS